MMTNSGFPSFSGHRSPANGSSSNNSPSHSNGGSSSEERSPASAESSAPTTPASPAPRGQAPAGGRPQAAAFAKSALFYGAGPLSKLALAERKQRRLDSEEAMRLLRPTHGPDGTKQVQRAPSDVSQVALGMDKFTAGASAQAPLPVDPSFRAERNSVGFGVVRNMAEGALKVAANNSAAFWNLTSDFTTAAQHHTASAIAGFSTLGVVGLGGGFLGAIQSKIGVSVGLIGLARADADKDVVDIHQNDATVRETRSRLVGAQLTTGAGNEIVAGGGRFYAATETKVSSEQADTFAGAERTLEQDSYFDRKKKGFLAGRLPFGRTRPTDIEQGLPPLDVTETRSRNFAASLGLSVLGLVLSGQRVNNDRSQVRIRRETEGARDVIELSTSKLTANGGAADLPIIANSVASQATLRTSEMKLTLPRGTHAEDILRQPKFFSSTKDVLPKGLNPAWLEDVSNPEDAIAALRIVEQQQDVEIAEVVVSTLKNSENVRASGAQILHSMVGKFSRVGVEADQSWVKTTIATPNTAQIAEGPTQSFRKELLGHGVKEISNSVLSIHSADVIFDADTQEPNVKVKRTTLLSNSFHIEDGSFADMESMASWAESMPVSLPPTPVRSRRPSGWSTFNVTASASIEVNKEEVRRLAQQGLFGKSLQAMTPMPDGHFDEALVNGLQSALHKEPSLVPKVAVALGKPEELQYQLDTDSVDKLTLDVNRLLVTMGSVVHGTSDSAQARLSRLRKADSLLTEIEDSQMLVNLPQFALNSDQQAELLSRLSALHRQVLQGAGVPSAEALRARIAQGGAGAPSSVSKASIVPSHANEVDRNETFVPEATQALSHS